MQGCELASEMTLLRLRCLSAVFPYILCFSPLALFWVGHAGLSLRLQTHPSWPLLGEHGALNFFSRNQGFTANTESLPTSSSSSRSKFPLLRQPEISGRMCARE